MFLFSTINIPQNDIEFFAELYTKYEPLMLHTARKYLDDYQAVEDIVNDCVEKLLRKIDTLKTLNSCTLSAYIVYTVRNTALNYNRRNRLKNFHMVPENDILPEVDYQNFELNPELILLRSELTKETQIVLDKLPEQYRELLIGKYFMKMSDKELSKALGCKQSSIRMMLTRARRKAYELMAEGEYQYD